MVRRWHGELEAARNSETEEKYRRYAATLEAHLAGCQQILDKARAPSSLSSRQCCSSIKGPTCSSCVAVLSLFESPIMVSFNNDIAAAPQLVGCCPPHHAEMGPSWLKACRLTSGLLCQGNPDRNPSPKPDPNPEVDSNLAGQQVDQTLGFLDQLKEQHHEVASKTRQLHDKCERLVRAH